MSKTGLYQFDLIRKSAVQKVIFSNQIWVFGNSSGCKSGKIMLALGKTGLKWRSEIIHATRYAQIGIDETHKPAARIYEIGLAGMLKKETFIGF